MAEKKLINQPIGVEGEGATRAPVIIEEVPNLQLYFHELIQEAIGHQHLQADEHISFYLVNLLSHFTKTEHIQRREDGEETPLAILFCKAQEESPEERARLLKYLGDFSLLISGFFQDSLSRKIVDVDYYMNMGGSAYSQLSTLGVFKKQPTLFNQLFSELSDRFVQWVDVISEVSEASRINSHQNLLRLYEKWIRTGSHRLKEILSEKGVIPVNGLKPEFIQ